MQYCMQQYGTKLITCSPTNHKGLEAEHFIKFLSNILVSNISGLGVDWHIDCKPCMLTYNAASSSNINDKSPFEKVLAGIARLFPQLHNIQSILVIKSFQQANEDMENNLKMFRSED